MIHLCSRLPDTRLRPYIKMYFGAADDTPPRVQRILPNGEIGLCFYRGDAVVYDGIGSVQSCVSGQMMQYQDILSYGRIDIVGAHLTTIGAHVLLQKPMNEIGSRTVALSALNDPELLALEDTIMTADGYEECFAAMDACFLHRLRSTAVDTLNVRRILRAIAYGQRHCAEALIPDIASEACLSQRHFSRLFTSMVGISPKEYLRLQRFQSALRELKSHADGPALPGNDTLTEIAWRNGYYDYAHLYSDFRKISGYSPRQLVERSENKDDAYGWRL